MTYLGKCPQHGTPVAASSEQAREAGYQIRAACCSRWIILTVVAGSVGNRECGEYCTTGTGKSCKCSCGGSNHGLAWRVAA